MRTRVQMLCHYGQPPRGLSPYGDALADALAGEPDVLLQREDYQAAYPRLLHPAVAGSAECSGEGGGLHWGDPRSWWRLARSPADVLHIQHWSAPLACYLWPVARMAALKGKRIVVTVHNPQPHERIPGAAILENRLFAIADALIVHGQRGADVLSARMGSRHRIHVVPHGVRIQTPPPVAAPADYEALGLMAERRYVSLFGNLRGYKGVAALLDAWRGILADCPDVDLVIAGRLWDGRSGRAGRAAAWVLGTGADAKHLEEAFADEALKSRVHLREGFLPDATIDALLRLSELAVFPYERFASQSGAACRAAGLGCPVLVSDVGELPELALDETWVVPPRDRSRLGTVLLRKLQAANGDLRSRQIEAVRSSEWGEVAKAHARLYAGTY